MPAGHSNPLAWITSIDGAPMHAAANPIHNGGFNIWQRGTTFTSVATGTYTADRWRYFSAGSTAVHSILRSTDVPAVAALVPLANYSIHLDVTTADATISAGDRCWLVHAIEGYTWAPFAQKQLTVGFWVKDTVTGIHCVTLYNSNTDRACVMEYTISASDTWEYKAVTFPASPSAGTWNYTDDVGVYLAFPLLMGSTYQTTPGSWQTTTSTELGSASMVNSLSSTSNNFKLWGVTMGLGSTVAPFWPRPYGEELARCQRYYEQAGLYWTGAAIIATTWFGQGQWMVEKRTTPTLSLLTTTPTIIQPGATAPTASGATLSGSLATAKGSTVTITGFTGLTTSVYYLSQTEFLAASADL